MGDFEELGTVLRIRESKFHKSRLVPLSVSATRELQIYLRQRRKAFAVHPGTPLLCNRHGGHFHRICNHLEYWESPHDRAIYLGQRLASCQCHRHRKLLPKNFHDLAHTGGTAGG